MMFPSHLLATLLVAYVASKVVPMTGKDWILAIAFGVAIDLDHLLQIPRYAATHGGIASLARVGEVVRWGAEWQGFMHTPWGLVAVAAACLLFASWAPALFWGLHLFQDFVVARHFVVFGGGVEFAAMAALAAVLLALMAWEHRGHAGRVAFPHYVRERVAFGVLSMVTSLRR